MNVARSTEFRNEDGIRTDARERVRDRLALFNQVRHPFPLGSNSGRPRILRQTLPLSRENRSRRVFEPAGGLCRPHGLSEGVSGAGPAIGGFAESPPHVPAERQWPTPAWGLR